MKKSTAPARALEVQPFTRSEIVHFAFTSKHLPPHHHLLNVGGAA
ncbi:hypothetical protein SGGMMB4_01718 [Sodalis glossinidius str. 'morsitans']|uniref:Uncharacterized protein n=1 Tax=Sodalis glossinidius (strain morsitans) TaxID=343509 RepID=A0A193QHD1_SODGM|nr:hypothetical protein SGGMMB4_01718 [Sodalis glossinidius str. 'morsitans']